MHFSKLILTTLAMSVSSGLCAPQLGSTPTPPGLTRAKNDVAALKSAVEASLAGMTSLSATIKDAVFYEIKATLDIDTSAILAGVLAQPAKQIANYAGLPPVVDQKDVQVILDSVQGLVDIATNTKRELNECKDLYMEQSGGKSQSTLPPAPCVFDVTVLMT